MRELERYIMLHEVYSVRDSKTEVFGQPFLQKAKGEAERSFQALANDPQTFVGKYPDDFDLYYLGQYDDHSGAFNVLQTPKHIMKAIHCVKTDKN